MNKIKKHIAKKLPIGPYFGSSAYELKHFFPDPWFCQFHQSHISFQSYPFECASVYTTKQISADKILSIDLSSFPCTIHLENELIFVEKIQRKKLAKYQERNGIESYESFSNWEEILEEFLDTELSEETKNRSKKRLRIRGLDSNEVQSIRKEVENQMLKYNFDTMMWEWCVLSLYDVLCAMGPALSAEEFSSFYYRAMEIEMRTGE